MTNTSQIDDMFKPVDRMTVMPHGLHHHSGSVVTHGWQRQGWQRGSEHVEEAA
jgi:hypothetical protein